MAKRVGVLVAHGMGKQTQDFAAPLIEAVQAELGVRAQEVAWQPVWWQAALAKRQKDLLERLEQGGPLHYRRLRDLVVHFLADAVAYQRVPPDASGKKPTAERQDTYEAIHALVADAVRQLRAEIGQDAPLIVVAHSLGCHVLSNYIWDMQKHPAAATPFERFETLAGMLTFGCNIPLFVLAHYEPQPITFPAPSVAQALRPGVTPEALRRAVRWTNIYDPDDPLGFPLKTLSQSYGQAVFEDVAENVGNLLVSLTPLSHNAYWTDKGVTTRLAAQIRDVIALT